jgi:DNA-binding beta-propeller fold protein YncE
VKIWLFLAAATGLLVTPPRSAAAEPFASRVTTVIPRAAGFFDYMLIDRPMHRLIVSHTGSDSVAFLNTATGKVERQLYVGAAHGIAIDERDNKYFVGTSGVEKGVVVVDRSALTISRRIATPGPVDALIFDTRRGRLFADEDNGAWMWVISARLNRVVAAIPTPQDSDKGEYDPASDRVYQNYTTTHSLLVIDPSSFRKLARWSTLPATNPHGLALDGRHHRIFAAGTNAKLAAIDMESGKLLSSINIARHVDQIALDERRGRLYCASGDGHLSLIDIRDDEVKFVADVAVPKGAHTLAVDPASGSVWISYGTEHEDYVMKLAP